MPERLRLAREDIFYVNNNFFSGMMWMYCFSVDPYGPCPAMEMP